MKPAFLTIYLLLAILLQAAAQKGQPVFGKVNKAELQMNDCAFDKGADALVLIDYGSTYYDRGTIGFSLFKTVFERRTRIKILKEKGLSQANVEIPFYANLDEEKIINLQARTYNIDEKGQVKTTEVTRNSIYTKKIGGGYSKKIIAFPEVKVGSIIEYRYTLQRSTDESLPDWFFQGSIPVLYSEYQLKIPELFRFTIKKSVIDSLEENKEVIDELLASSQEMVKTKSIKSNYIMRRLPAVKEEPFMGAAKDYVQRLEFKLIQVNYDDTKTADISTKWKDVINNLMDNENFGLQLQQKSNETNAFIEKANKIYDPEERMKFIFYTLRNGISWNGSYQIFTDNGVLKTWQVKTGNSADINLLLIKFLKDAGINAAPILFSTRDNGMVMPNYPYDNQFNTVLASVTVGGKNYVLDATDKISSYRLITDKIVNTKGLLLDGENLLWKDVSAEKKFKIIAAVRGGIDDSGNMQGTAQLDFYDYARVRRVEEWQFSNQKYKNDYFIQPYRAVKTEDVSATNLNTDSLPFEQKIKFSTVLNGSGEYRYFNINLFSGMENNPFVEENRLSDIDFGVRQDYVIFGNYTIPQNFVFDGVPENIVLTTSDNSIVFNRTILVESNVLNVRMTIEFKKPFYSAGFYAEFKEFYKEIFNKLNEQVVIKKNANP